MAPKRDVPTSELIVYVVAWIFSVLYSIYCFTISSDKYFRNYKDEYADFGQSWLINQRKDVSDNEWRVIKLLIRKIVPWIIVSTVVAEFLRTLKLIKVLQIWQISIAMFFILIEFGVIMLTILSLQPLLFSLLLIKPSKSLVWFCSISILLFTFIYGIYIIRLNFFLQMGINEHIVHLMIISVCWMNLKCTSYCLDYIDEERVQQEFTEFLAYCIYLPNVICGPFIPYGDFKSCYHKDGDLKKRLLQLLMDVSRFSFWLAFIEFCLHYIYVNAIGFHPEWIQSFNSWALYGYGYAMGQFFHLKYLVTYGLATSFAKFEHVKVPSLPVCIGRIHLYSDMWKYFDAGLYNFLLRYLYIPLMKEGLIGNRLLSSFICFAFVFVWHGCQYFIMVWSLLNYIGVLIEFSAGRIGQNYIEDSKFSKALGPAWMRRLTCMTASPLLAMSAMSNFYFFAGVEIGHIFLYRILNDKFQSTLILLAILYTSCQVSTEIKSRRNERNVAKTNEK